jgi:pimeloyl-ACP methyl ester carboxylesterase
MRPFQRTFLLLGLVFAHSSFAQEPELKSVNVNGVEISYVEKGSGEPMILLHGGLFDYRSWQNQFDEFAQKYRVISYSRRYSYPNKNPITAAYRPAITEAEDLKYLLKKLGLKKVHLVGLSYGAFAGLIFALENPKMVVSMVLAEPPAHQIIRDLPGGEASYHEFLDGLKPMVEAFRQGNDRRAIVIFNQKMGRDFDKLPENAAKSMIQNAPALKAINLSPDPFPAISKARLRSLKVPTLMVKGERADRLHSWVSDEIAHLIPNAKTVVIPNAGHNSPRDNPAFFNRTVLDFLDSTRRKG